VVVLGTWFGLVVGAICVTIVFIVFQQNRREPAAAETDKLASAQPPGIPGKRRRLLADLAMAVFSAALLAISIPMDLDATGLQAFELILALAFVIYVKVRGGFTRTSR